MISFDNFLNEKKITLKRQYTENHPAVTVSKNAAVRNKMLEAVKDGKLTKEEFKGLLKEMTKDSSRWMKRNTRFFNVSEDGITLTAAGNKTLAAITVNEGNAFGDAVRKAKEAGEKEFDFEGKTYKVEEQTIQEGRAFVAAAKKAKDAGDTEFEYKGKKFPVTIKEKKETVTEWLHTSFSGFTSTINEAFGSQVLASLFIKTNGKLDNDLAKGFYTKTKIAMDKVQDEDILVVDPSSAYKAKGGNTITFYISDNEKENPYAPADSYSSAKRIPGGGYLLAVANGDNKFYDNVWVRGAAKNTRSFKVLDGKPGGGDTIGIEKRYRGWDATGLNNVKRISEVADRAVIINVDLLQQKYSTDNKRAERLAAKSGATAFKSDKDFKTENTNRYHAILAQKAASMPLDSVVADAIDTLSNQIKDALIKGEKGQYGDIIIGISSKGRECKMSDAAYHMKNILDEYQRYVGYVKQQEDSIARYGESESWYKREIQNYAKSVKDKVDQIGSMSYAW